MFNMCELYAWIYPIYQMIADALGLSVEAIIPPTWYVQAAACGIFTFGL